MQITQKKGRTVHTFRFEQDHFNFAYKDKRGEGDVDFPYVDVPKKTSTVIEQNEWLRNVGLLWCALGAIDIAWLFSHGKTRVSLWLILGVVCTAIAHLTKIRYTVFRLDEGAVYVIKGKHHDAVVKEMMRRREEQLRRWYGEIDLDNDTENEIRKFHWLRDEGVISQHEAEKKIAQVRFLHGGQTANRSRSLN